MIPAHGTTCECGAVNAGPSRTCLLCGARLSWPAELLEDDREVLRWLDRAIARRGKDDMTRRALVQARTLLARDIEAARMGVRR